jgi:hypothetical protein
VKRSEDSPTLLSPDGLDELSNKDDALVRGKAKGEERKAKSEKREPANRYQLHV